MTQSEDKSGERHSIDSDKDPTAILLHYPSIIENTIGYIPPRVKIEISCLSMDEPTEVREIRSMIGESFGEEDSATIDFTLPERVLDAWKEDYANMRRFFIYGQSLEFDALIQRLKELQDRVRNM